MSSRWRERFGHTLGFRLALWYVALFIGSSVLLVVLTYVLLATSLRQRDHELIRSTLARYAAEYDRGGLDALSRAIVADRAIARSERLFVRVAAGGEEAVFLSTPDDWSEFDLARLDRPSAGSQSWSELPGRREAAVLEVASARLLDGTLVQVGKSSESRIGLLRHYRTVSALSLLGIIVIGLAGGALLTRWTLRPAWDLIAAVQDIVRTGRVEARVLARQTGDPLDQFAALFNGMLDRIESLIAAMRGSLDNVAHDLRTPMTRLRSTAEQALQTGDTPESYREALADCVEESDRVVAMLETLMDISEAETGTLRLNLEPLSVASLLSDAVDLHADLADAKAITLSVRAPDTIIVSADRNRMRQALANLLDNAVKYTPHGGRIEIAAEAAGPDAVIAVRDSGIGIASEDLPRIWDRLYRADHSRSERGLGLGLSLVRAIVQAHRGRVEVESTLGGGSTFRLFLPLAPAA
jgi:signal transduction histidine kinase